LDFLDPTETWDFPAKNLVCAQAEQKRVMPGSPASASAGAEWSKLSSRWTSEQQWRYLRSASSCPHKEL